MSLEGLLRQAERARAELERVASSTHAWSDAQRTSFDRQRMQPLDAVGARLVAGLKRAEEQCVRAERLLS